MLLLNYASMGELYFNLLALKAQNLLDLFVLL